jgi:hypothetical protein
MRFTNLEWDESKHRRVGGKFAPKGGGGEAPKTPAKAGSGEPKTRSIAGLGSVTTGGGKTVLKVSWLGKVAAETAVGAAAVAALPEVAVGAAGVILGGFFQKIAAKAATAVGSKVLGVVAQKAGATAAQKAAGIAAGKVLAGAVQRNTLGSGALGFLKDRLSRVSVETEDGWFKPSTITIDQRKDLMSRLRITALRNAAKVTNFTAWDESKVSRKAGRFASKGQAEAVSAHYKQAITGAKKDLSGRGPKPAKQTAKARPLDPNARREGGKFAPRDGSPLVKKERSLFQILRAHTKKIERKESRIDSAIARLQEARAKVSEVKAPEAPVIAAMPRSKKTEWKSTNGTPVGVEVEVDYEIMRNGNMRTDGPKQVYVFPVINGQRGMAGTLAYGTKGLPAGFPANVGRLAIPPQVLPEIEAALEAARAEVTAHNEPFKKAAKQSDAAYKAMKAMEKKMAYGEPLR